MINPFESPSVQPVAQSKYDQDTSFATSTKKLPWLSFIAFACPFIFPVFLYATWLVAWAHLGHMPRPMLDDPKHIGSVVSMLCFSTGIVLSIQTVLLPYSVIAQLLVADKNWLTKIGKTALLILVWIAVIFLLRCDFGNVIEWFLD